MQQHIDSYDFKGKKAIVRVDFNVPLDENFKITDDTRIRAALPTLKKVLAEGGSLILMSHLGRPKGVDPKFSLKHIVGHVSEKLGVPVQFADDCQKADAQAAALKPGEVLMLENLRYYAEEEGKPRGLAEDATDEEKAAAKKAVKESQKAFVKKLASYADCYINDAFGTAHRAHASTALIASYFPNDKMFGYLMEKEVKAIDNVLKNAQPFGDTIHDMFEGKLGIDLLRAAQMGHQDEGTPFLEHFLERRHRGADAGVVGDVEILVERDVEVHADNGFLTGKVVRVDVLLHNTVICFLNPAKITNFNESAQNNIIFAAKNITKRTCT